MYKNPSIIYGFHGCDKQVAMKILNHEFDFKPSSNGYDWLGSGIYFWENNYERARQYAEIASRRRGSKIKEPFVIGAVIDLGNCLDLLNQKYLDFISYSYNDLKDNLENYGSRLPENKSFGENDFDFKKRNLDCAVILHAHSLAEDKGIEFDSVRAGFWEGEPLYAGAMFRKYNHIQVAIRNPSCIKGIFLPRLT